MKHMAGCRHKNHRIVMRALRFYGQTLFIGLGASCETNNNVHLNTVK